MAPETATKKRATRGAPIGHERMADMSARIGLSKSLLYKWLSPRTDSDFPRPIKLSRNLAVFNVEQVNKWLADRGIVLPGTGAVPAQAVA